ncbi:MAG: chemotaxis protein CheD [Desulfovibrio sp.]
MGEPHQIVVNISDMKFSTRPDDVIVTFSLGSCLGVTAYDPRRRVGAMMHALLPSEASSPERARKNPFMFVGAGFQAMLARLEQLGASRRDLVFKMAGGADMRGDTLFHTGERNVEALQRMLREERLRLGGQEVGGTIPRTLYLRMDTGEVVVKTFGRLRNI